METFFLVCQPETLNSDVSIEGQADECVNRLLRCYVGRLRRDFSFVIFVFVWLWLEPYLSCMCDHPVWVLPCALKHFYFSHWHLPQCPFSFKLNWIAYLYLCHLFDMSSFIGSCFKSTMESQTMSTLGYILKTHPFLPNFFVFIHLITDVKKSHFPKQWQIPAQNCKEVNILSPSTRSGCIWMSVQPISH